MTSDTNNMALQFFDFSILKVRLVKVLLCSAHLHFYMTQTNQQELNQLRSLIHIVLWKFINGVAESSRPPSRCLQAGGCDQRPSGRATPRTLAHFLSAFHVASTQQCLWCDLHGFSGTNVFVEPALYIY